MRVDKLILLGIVVLLSMSPANAGVLVERQRPDLPMVPAGRSILPLKIDGTYLYLSIRFLGPMHTGIDLYLAEPGGLRKKLHVSAALGEVEWKDGV